MKKAFLKCYSSLRRSLSENLRRAALLCVCILLCDRAEARSYWLEKGGVIPATCPGETNGTILKLANGTNAPFLITGLLNCRDTGTAYHLSFEFLSVRINPQHSAEVNRDRVEFDWLGLAAYRPLNATEERIEWQYDEARMIEGELDRTSNDVLHFGNLTFDIPKEAADSATHFTFYLTWKGRLETFGVM